VLLKGNGPVGKTGTVYDGKFTKRKLCWKSLCHQSIFYHKSVFNEIGLFDLRYPILADRVFNMKAFATKNIEPYFVDTLIAIYSTKGLSGSTFDDNFNRDLPSLIKNIFGFQYYLWFVIQKYFYYKTLRPMSKILKKIFTS
jgi:hypothetical protein